MANTKSVSIQMQKILDEYDDKVNRVLEDTADRVSREAVDKLQNTSPKRTGEYASGWTVKKLSRSNIIVHNATHYQLTHLLENGHIIRNKKGTYGRTSGTKHIKPVEEWAVDELPRRIIEDIP